MSDATELASAIRAGRLTASAAMDASIAAARKYEALGAVAWLRPETGREASVEWDRRGPAGAPFAGVPTLAKDLGAPFAGFPASAGSRLFAREGDGEDSDLAVRFRQAGLCVFGLTTSPEFGLSLASEPSEGPVCRNPLATGLSAGGSSGGAAASVAAGIVAIAHATDAGGSIRVPAACCGLVGLKPGRGSVPGGPGFGNHLAGIASELAVCRSVRDAVTIFAAVAGDARGPFPPTDFREPTSASLRIGLLADTGKDWPTASDRSTAVEAAAFYLERGGHHIVRIPWARMERLVRSSTKCFADIVAINLAELFERLKLDLSASEPMTQAVVERGSRMDGTAVWAVTNAMVVVSRDLWDFFDDIDVLLTPMLSAAPRPIGAFRTDHRDTELHFSRMTAFAPLAPLANISGFPAITIPFDTDADGLPVPVQLVAPMGMEYPLLALAAWLEHHARWHHRFPVAGLPQ